MSLRQRRRDRGWTQAQLAEFSGLSLRTIQRIERGDPPNDESLKALAAVFETHLADLRNSLPVVERTLGDDEKAALRQIRKRRSLLIELTAYVLIVTLLGLANWALDAHPAWVGSVALGWGIWLGLRAWDALEASNLFGPDWERRELEKRRGEDNEKAPD